MGDLVLFNERTYIRGLRAAAQHDFPAMEHETLNSGTCQRQIMCDRQRDEQDGLAAYTANGCGGLRIVRIIVVGARNQFRNTGGATRKLKNRWIVRVDGYLRELRSRERSQRANHFRKRHQPVRGRSQNNSALQTRTFSPNSLNHFGVIEIAVAARHNASRGAGKSHELADLPVTVARQSRNRNASNFLNSKIQNYK